MRLLGTTIGSDGGLEIKEFHDQDRPPYAILSHTWGDDEVLFADLRSSDVMERAGFRKIQFTLDQARLDGFQWAWIDTACINKDSSAELSEAINAMYSWYSQAAVCYVYLSDVDSKTDSSWDSQFHLSRWFIRGWTLQELLAPRHLVFYSRAWECFGTKLDLISNIEAATGIIKVVLDGTVPIFAASIAQRMSWAASRNTTRVEDLAYCLMGLFDVNMPLLYGEGSRAFIRLQEEIMKGTDDQSLFAWRAICDRDSHGLLADSPCAFRESAHIVPIRGLSSERENHIPHAMTNRGLRLECPSRQVDATHLFAYLECQIQSNPHYIGLVLYHTRESTRHYLREACDRLEYLRQLSTDWKSIYVRQLAASSLTTADTAFYSVGIARFDIRGMLGPYPTISRGAYLDILGENQHWNPLRRPTQHRALKVKIGKQANLLSAYLGLPKNIFGDAVLLIGTDGLGQLAFDVLEVFKEPEISELGLEHEGNNARLSLPPFLVATFEPQPPGTVMQDLRDYELKVALHEFIEQGRNNVELHIKCWKKSHLLRSSKNKGTVQTLWESVKALGA